MGGERGQRKERLTNRWLYRDGNAWEGPTRGAQIEIQTDRQRVPGRKHRQKRDGRERQKGSSKGENSGREEERE